MKDCASPVCAMPAHARGWCASHYDRLRRFGDAKPHIPIAPPKSGQPKLPALPLIKAVENRGGLQGVIRNGTTPEGRRLRRAYYRAKARGWVQESTADDLAIHLVGVHPTDLWETV